MSRPTSLPPVPELKTHPLTFFSVALCFQCLLVPAQFGHMNSHTHYFYAFCLFSIPPTSILLFLFRCNSDKSTHPLSFSFLLLFFVLAYLFVSHGAVRAHRVDDHVRHHGPRGGPAQAHGWQDPWLLLLNEQREQSKTFCRRRRNGGLMHMSRLTACENIPRVDTALRSSSDMPSPFIRRSS